MTVSASVFTEKARDTIYEAAGQRCIGCGRADGLSCQHRRARGMGGSRMVAIGHPSNGLALCGDGVRGCHGWTEHNPTFAALLGWRLVPGEEPFEAPFWQRSWGWRVWGVEEDGFVVVRFYDPDDLDRPAERAAAVAAMLLARDVPMPKPRTKV